MANSYVACNVSALVKSFISRHHHINNAANDFHALWLNWCGFIQHIVPFGVTHTRNFNRVPQLPRSSQFSAGNRKTQDPFIGILGKPTAAYVLLPIYTTRDKHRINICNGSNQAKYTQQFKFTHSLQRETRRQRFY